MANSLYAMLNNNLPDSNMTNMIRQFQNFKRNFKGNPQQQVQMLLNSGKITQAQYNNAVQMANALKNLIG